VSFSDHFSEVADAYAAFRPSYPDALGVFLASVAPGRGLAWDCATGSGQAATMLAAHFDSVVATDASAEQIASAEPHERVRYEVAPAHESGLPDHSCDLVTVAQAAHWLDLPLFYAEARRVLKPGGVLAIWCYVRAQTNRHNINEAIRHFQYERIERYWPPGRELVEDGYRSLPFPFERIETPELEMTARWRCAELLGYIGTWSAVARYRAAETRDPMADLADSLTRLCPQSEEVLDIRWPLYIRAGRP
jgi:SAM-dependent methyltransferase